MFFEALVLHMLLSGVECRSFRALLLLFSFENKCLRIDNKTKIKAMYEHISAASSRRLIKMMNPIPLGSNPISLG